ncbi:MAG TPA: AAA family ATPase [Chloroflexota bacterium]|jgi:chromosome segregation protein
MFLKRLDLQGFKTFASRTEIDFSGGLTAIVGPNGVGKSNLTDAIRWVLGEQSMRALRGKKTEDLVFAGGAGKPPAGMAEVSITFDNATGWLDTPYQEVVVTRRAYRSGENEYYLNRARTRLRDVLDLLLKANLSPNGYTVMGQGMVDLALSLRPEERRELFEDAAGIRHHYLRLTEARNRLAATEANLGRVGDVIAEIEPRLKQLERRARQLRERESVQADLCGHLAAWYGDRWLRLRAEADASETSERQARDALAEARRAADASRREVAELGARQERLRARLGEIGHARADLTARAERLARELALRRERAESSRARGAELGAEIEALELRARDDELAALAARERIAGLAADAAALTETLIEAEGANDRRRERASTLREQLLQAQAATERLRQERVSLESELCRVDARRQELGAETERQLAAAQRDEERSVAAQAEVDRARAAQAEAQQALESNAREATRRRDEIAAARRAQEAIGVRLAETARRRATFQGRLDLLNDSRDGYAGYYAGVRAVLAAAAPPPTGPEPASVRAGQPATPPPRPSPARSPAGSPARGGPAERLDGIVGLVAALIRVPTELETALEVALGSHLQDIVVERWEHAEAAVEMLKRTGAGRATFLPLDTIRAHPTPLPLGEGWGEGSLLDGRHGVASQLVKFDEGHRAVVEHLLGRTLVVDDLAVARRVLGRLATGWQIVTVAGEVVRAGGAVTGGSTQSGDRTVLARERERRELPGRLAAIVAEGRSLEGELAAQRAHQNELEAALRGKAEERGKLELAEARAREAAAAAGERVQRLRREVEWSRELAARATAELGELVDRERTAQGRLAAFPDGTAEYAGLIGALEGRLTDLAAATREQSERLTGFRNSVAVIEGERRAQARLLEGHEAQRRQVAAEIEARRGRVEELAAVAATLDDEAEELEAARGAIDDQRSALESEVRPTQLELAALTERIGQLQSDESALGARLNELADRLRTESVAAQSARDRLDALAREAALALGELRPLAADGAPGPEAAPGDAAAHGRSGVPFAAAEGTETPDAPDEGASGASDLEPPDLIYAPLLSPDATWRRIELLRGRLRGIGTVDATAGQEYAETLARHAFLSGQAADLIEAKRLLEEAIAELETTMRQRFESTFEAVAAAFKRHFTALFGGGTARLVLAESESGAPGVEIVAQPPGKRAQSLSLLSGGERALTAVAILFAILEVNPTRVCVLDEVDAALDDANIVRFAQTLRKLSEGIQFVVITHNRGTMEAADALYGITMHDRSVSRTVSLKLSDIPEPDRSPLPVGEG